MIYRCISVRDQAAETAVLDAVTGPLAQYTFPGKSHRKSLSWDRPPAKMSLFRQEHPNFTGGRVS